MINNQEKLEDQLKGFLIENNINFERDIDLLNNSKFQGIDFYLPDFKIALEVCTVFNDNSSRPDFDGKSSSAYFKNKVLEHEKNGYKLILCWEMWMNNTIQWSTFKNILLHSMGKSSISVFARKCYIKELCPKDNILREFYINNSLFKYKGGTYSYGMFRKDTSEMVMAITVRVKKDKDDKICHLIERCCALNGHNISGGVSKMLKYIEKEKCQDADYLEFFIISDYSKGRGLIKSGFKSVQSPQPILYQVQCNELQGSDIMESTLVLPRGRGRYQDFKDNIAQNIEARLFQAGAEKYRKYLK